MKNFKLSPAQQLIVNAVLSAAGGAATTGITAATQYYTSNGFNVPALINVFMAASFVLFGKTLYDFIPAHFQTILQAYQDTIGDLRNVQANIATPIQQAPVQPSQSQPGPYVVIHAGQGSTVSTPPQGGSVIAQPAAYIPAVSQEVQPVQVAQVPFPAVIAQTQSSDILGNIPNPVLTQQLPMNNVTGQYAIYGVAGQ